MGSILALSKAAFGYGGAPVLTGVDLTICPGDFWGIAGPNGAGKTTLFRGMLALIPPLEGKVERTAGAIGFVPQRESLDPLFPLRVEEVVEMGAYARLTRSRRLQPADRALVHQSLAQVDLQDRARALFSSLSGGQRQRALIARALLVDPVALLLDEPTSGVDRATQRSILRLLLTLNRERRIAVLLVTHDLASLRDFAHKVVWVEEGRVELRAVDDALHAWSDAGGKPGGESPRSGAIRSDPERA